MSDNISLVLTVIVAVIVLVLVPTLSVLVRQDNISNNVLLTLTTEYVDNIRSKGYITEKEYNEFVEKINYTGNSFEVKLEIYEKKYIAREAGESFEYVEQLVLMNNNDVFNCTDSSSNCVTFSVDDTESGNEVLAYHLQAGDEVYVKVYNTNTTLATLLFSFITGKLDGSKVMEVNYGGQVFLSDETSYTKYQSDKKKSPTVQIAGIYNKSGNTTYIEKESLNGLVDKIPSFNLNKSADRTIKFILVLRNANAMTKAEFDDVIQIGIASKQIKFYIDNDTQQKEIIIDESKLDTRNNVYSCLLSIKLNVMEFSEAVKAYITVDTGLIIKDGLTNDYVSEMIYLISSGEFEVGDEDIIKTEGFDIYDTIDFNVETAETAYIKEISVYNSLDNAKNYTNKLTSGQELIKSTIYYRVDFISKEALNVLAETPDVHYGENGEVVSKLVDTGETYKIYSSTATGTNVYLKYDTISAESIKLNNYNVSASIFRSESDAINKEYEIKRDFVRTNSDVITMYFYITVPTHLVNTSDIEIVLHNFTKGETKRFFGNSLKQVSDSIYSITLQKEDAGVNTVQLKIKGSVALERHIEIFTTPTVRFSKSGNICLAIIYADENYEVYYRKNSSIWRSSGKYLTDGDGVTTYVCPMSSTGSLKLKVVMDGGKIFESPSEQFYID